MVQHIKSLNHKDHRNLNLYSKCDLTFHYVHLYNIFKATLMLPREAPPQKKKKKKKKKMCGSGYPTNPSYLPHTLNFFRQPIILPYE